MGEEKKESPELGMSMIARFACEHPELLGGIERYDEYEWRFRIGVGGPGFWLRFNDYSKSYTVNYCKVSQGAGEVLAKNLRDGYLKALNAELAERVPEFAEFREKVLERFVENDDVPYAERLENAKRVVTELPFWMKNQRTAMEAAPRRQMTATVCGNTPQSEGVTFNIDLR